MLNFNSKLLGSAAVALLAAAYAAPASALPPPPPPPAQLYSGGGTLAEKVYRDIFDCYGSKAGGDLIVGLASPPALCNTANAFRAPTTVLYVGVGSGNGKIALVAHDPAQFTLPTGGAARIPDTAPVPSAQGGAAFGPFFTATTPDTTSIGAAWPANKGTLQPFPSVTFVGSDDPLTTAELTTYSTNSAGNWGPVNQFPALVTAIAVPYRATTTGWNPNGLPVVGNTGSHVNITTQALCGIFTGKITQWDDVALKVGNQGATLGTGPITVFWRNDSSGSTFLFTNALINQCATTANPIPGSWLAAAGNGGVANNKFFINVKAAGLLPASFNTTGAAGSGGMKGSINGNDGSIGYVSPDFVSPIDGAGPLAANLQDSGTLALAPNKFKYVAPSAKNAAALVKTALPPVFTANSCTVGAGFGQSPDGVCADNPVNWAPVFPAGAAKAYPIGGFTLIDSYSCYASAGVVNALNSTTTKTLGLFQWYMAGKAAKPLAANGFGALPKTWMTAIKTLLGTNAPTRIEAAGSAGKCSTAGGA